MPEMYAQQACTFGAGSDAGKQKLQLFGLIDSYRTTTNMFAVCSMVEVAYICSRYYRAPELIFGATN